jgi:hypothetical protein
MPGFRVAFGRLYPALAGHRRWLERRRPSGAAETFLSHVIFGRPVGIVLRWFAFAHLSSRGSLFNWS